MNPYKTSLPFIFFFTIPTLLSSVCPVRPSLASPVSPSPLPCSVCPGHRRPEAGRQRVADPKLLLLPPTSTDGLYQTRSPLPCFLFSASRFSQTATPTVKSATSRRPTPSTLPPRRTRTQSPPPPVASFLSHPQRCPDQASPLAAAGR